MSYKKPKRVSRPDHHHPLSHGDGVPPVLKAVLALAFLPVALLVAVVLSLRAELAPDRLAERPSPDEICAPLTDAPARAGGPVSDARHLCIH